MYAEDHEAVNRARQKLLELLNSENLNVECCKTFLFSSDSFQFLKKHKQQDILRIQTISSTVVSVDPESRSIRVDGRFGSCF
jgi:hypothetical protein